MSRTLTITPREKLDFMKDAYLAALSGYSARADVAITIEQWRGGSTGPDGIADMCKSAAYNAADRFEQMLVPDDHRCVAFDGSEFAMRAENNDDDLRRNRERGAGE